MTSQANALPRSILVGVVGLFGIVALIVGAIALRSPVDDQCVPTAAVSTGSVAARARPAPSTTSAIGAVPTEAAGPEPARGSPASVPENAREVRAKFGKDMQMRRIKEAVASLSQLLEIDPTAPTDGEVRRDIVELAMRVTLLEGPEPDSVFEQISSHMGTTGADILYELLTTKGGSRAAKRAEDLLKNEEVRERGTPALRIAYDLRTTKSCDDKIALFDRAMTDGDGRTLGQLQLLNKECGRRGGGDCCLKNDPKLKEAIEALKASRSN